MSLLTPLATAMMAHWTCGASSIFPWVNQGIYEPSNPTCFSSGPGSRIEWHLQTPGPFSTLEKFSFFKVISLYAYTQPGMSWPPHRSSVRACVNDMSTSFSWAHIVREMREKKKKKRSHLNAKFLFVIFGDDFLFTVAPEAKIERRRKANRCWRQMVGLRK